MATEVIHNFANTNGQLPEGWRSARFDDFAQNISERVDPAESDADIYVGLEHLDGDSLKIRHWGEPADVIGQKLAFTKGDVIFGRRRAYQRKLGVADVEGICSAHAMVVRARAEAMATEFLPFFMQSDLFMERAIAISVGSLSPTINWKTLRSQQFRLPPLDQQRRLAEVLWAAEATIESHIRLHSSVVSLLDAIVGDFLGAGWDHFPCEKVYAAPPRNGLSPRTNAEQRGYPTLCLGAVRDGRIVPNGNVKFAEIDDDELEKFRLHRRDLLVVRGNGNRDLCGRCGIVEEVPQNCFYPDLLIRISFDADKVVPEFACLQWNTALTHRRLLSRAKSTNGIWKVNGKDLKQHRIAVPPVEEQLRLLKLVAHPSHVLSKVIDTIERLRDLKLELLTQMTTGAVIV